MLAWVALTSAPIQEEGGRRPMVATAQAAWGRVQGSINMGMPTEEKIVTRMRDMRTGDRQQAARK